MGKQEQKILDGVRGLLDSGEEPLAAIIAQPKGTTKGTAGRGALGAAGAMMGGSERKAAEAAASQAEIELSTPCAIVLTPKRLLTVRIGAPIGLGLGGKVKELLSSVPINEVEGIDVKKIALRQNITLRARGQTIELEANGAAGASDLASKLASLKAG